MDIANWKIYELHRRLDAGQPLPFIARTLGLSLASATAQAARPRPDTLQPLTDVQASLLRYKCETCGAWVPMPCLACEVRPKANDGAESGSLDQIEPQAQLAISTLRASGQSIEEIASAVGIDALRVAAILGISRRFGIPCNLFAQDTVNYSSARMELQTWQQRQDGPTYEK